MSEEEWETQKRQILKLRHKNPKREAKLCLELLWGETDVHAHAFAYLYLSDAYRVQGYLEKALRFAQTGIIIQKRQRLDELEMMQQHMLGLIYFHMGDELSALEAYLSCLKLADEKENHMLVAAVCLNMSKLYMRVGAYEKCEMLLQKSIKSVYQANSNPENICYSIGWFYYYQSRLYIRQRDFEKAIRSLHMMEQEIKSAYFFHLIYAEYYCAKQEQEKAQMELKRMLLMPEEQQDIPGAFEEEVVALQIAVQVKAVSEVEQLLGRMKKKAQIMDVPFVWLVYYHFRIGFADLICDTKRKADDLRIFYRLSREQEETMDKMRIIQIKNRMELREKTQDKNHLIKKSEELLRLASTDQLTGLFNRNSFYQALRKNYQKAEKEKKHIAIFMVDVDYFKEYNDTYGHPEGDICIQKIAGLLLEEIGNKGNVGRFGGDEMIAVLLTENRMELTKTANRILNGVRELGIEHKGSKMFPLVTISMGIADGVPKPGVDITDYIHMADKALYRAKRGRNRYCMRSMEVMGEE